MNEMLVKMGTRYPRLASNLPEVQAAYEILEASFREGGKLLVCGNGGSASDSEHIVGELMKGYLSSRPLPPEFRQKLVKTWPEHGSYLAEHLQGALPAISLVSQTSLLTASSNDIAADMVFAQQVYGYGLPGDVLLGISTSGRSANVVLAVLVARAKGLKTIALTGKGGGDLSRASDVAIAVTGDTTAEIQEGHVAIYHTLCGMLEETFFPG